MLSAVMEAFVMGADEMVTVAIVLLGERFLARRDFYAAGLQCGCRHGSDPRGQSLLRKKTLSTGRVRHSRPLRPFPDEVTDGLDFLAKTV